MSSLTCKKSHLVNTTTVSIGCGGGCKTPGSLLSVVVPGRRRRRNSSSGSSSSTPTSSGVITPPLITRCSSSSDSDSRSLTAVRSMGRRPGGVAVEEKNSDDPYLDFRRSMLQMILDREIYSKDDLRELLNCFLQLNSPYYHPIIVRAFADIWNAVYSADRKPQSRDF